MPQTALREVPVELAPILSAFLFYFGSSATGGPPPVEETTPPAPIRSRGTLDRQSVRYYVRLHQPAVRFCYVQELGRRPTLRTTVRVGFTVEASGKVSACRSGSSALEQCVSRAMCAIRFPQVHDEREDGSTVPSTQSTQVSYGFRFQPARRGASAEEPAPRGAPTRSPAQAASSPSAPPAPPPAAAPRAPAPTPAVAPVPTPKVKRPPLIIRPKTDDPLDGIDSGDPL